MARTQSRFVYLSLSMILAAYTAPAAWANKPDAIPGWGSDTAVTTAAGAAASAAVPSVLGNLGDDAAAGPGKGAKGRVPPGKAKKAFAVPARVAKGMAPKDSTQWTVTGQPETEADLDAIHKKNAAGEKALVRAKIKKESPIKRNNHP